MKLTNTQALKRFITEDQILECMIEYETSRVEGAKLLRNLIFDEWRITTTEAMGILHNIQKEWAVRAHETRQDL